MKLKTTRFTYSVIAFDHEGNLHKIVPDATMWVEGSVAAAIKKSTMEPRGQSMGEGKLLVSFIIRNGASQVLIDEVTINDAGIQRAREILRGLSFRITIDRGSPSLDPGLFPLLRNC